jgi:hypothetical protein
MKKVICSKCHHENLINDRYCLGCGYELPKIVSDNVESTDADFSDRNTIVKKRLIGYFIGAVMFVLAYFAVQQFIFKSSGYDKVLMQVASELNKTCPIMVDEFTRLDNAVAVPDNIFQYNYTLVKTTKTEVSLDTFRKYVEPAIINNIKTNPELKFFRDNKITMIYYYKDKNGEFVNKFTVTPDQYAK